jgi:chromosomal replication initiator protein
MERSLDQIWVNCLEFIKDNVSIQAYKTWFEPIKPVQIQGNTLIIEVPSQFFYEWLEEHYIKLLKMVVKKELGADGSLEYSIVMDNSPNEANKAPYTIKLPTSNKSAVRNPSVSPPYDMQKQNHKEIPNPFIIPGIKKVKINSNLIESNSFESFVEGDCNRLARSAGYAVSENPGKTSFNPLFLYSATGLGKTHLSQAIGIQVKNNYPDKTVLYVHSNQFMQQFIEAVRNNNQNDFIHFYQMVDLLIIDDIHHLSGKEKTLDVFFQVFNYLHQNDKQIIITSDIPPVELSGFNNRLLSRFKWGLAADLQTPDLETRIAIIGKKLYNEGIEMPRDVVEYLAYSITNNVRELEGALISILAQASLNKKDITIDLAKQIIDKYVKSNNREISIEYIQKVICEYFQLPLDVINSKTRKREVVQARQLAMFFSKKHTKSSLAHIGKQCGNKDHATVLHAVKTINNLAETDKKFRVYVNDLDKQIKLQ